jgi:hypothetical protein
MSNWVLTYTGRKFNFNDLMNNDIQILDIAHALSMTCRYGGATKYFYSVAQHSVYLSEEILKDTHDQFLSFDALMHDAEEAYVGDMKTPLKSMIPVFSEIALQVDKGIRQKFAHLNLASEMQEKTKEYDRRILLDERKALMIQSEHKWDMESDGTEPLGIYIEPWSPARAKMEFLEMFMFLTGERNET